MGNYKTSEIKASLLYCEEEFDPMENLVPNGQFDPNNCPHFDDEYDNPDEFIQSMSLGISNFFETGLHLEECHVNFLQQYQHRHLVEECIKSRMRGAGRRVTEKVLYIAKTTCDDGACIQCSDYVDALLPTYMTSQALWLSYRQLAIELGNVASFCTNCKKPLFQIIWNHNVDFTIHGE